MNCMRCHRQIKPAQQGKPVEVHEDGALKGLMHPRCARLEHQDRVTKEVSGSDRWSPDKRKDAYQESADYEKARERQRAVAEAREVEDVPEDESDWRDPLTMDLNELA